MEIQHTKTYEMHQKPRAVLRGNFIVIDFYTKKRNISNKQPEIIFQRTKKKEMQSPKLAEERK